MTEPDFETVIDAAWAEALACDPRAFRCAGTYLVPGGPDLAGFAGIYLARIGTSLFVYCPESRRAHVQGVIEDLDPVTGFSPETCARLAGDRDTEVHGPSWHGFVDSARFTKPVEGDGQRLDAADPSLSQLRRDCGEAAWAEGGFAEAPSEYDGALYGIRNAGQLLAAGNLTPFRGCPADVGLLTHPAFRGHGLGTRLAVQMVSDALPRAGLVRYRALLSNGPSLGIARTLGFQGRGESYMARP